jgi:tetratricopeptide (TPR) repeat protein
MKLYFQNRVPCTLQQTLPIFLAAALNFLIAFPGYAGGPDFMSMFTQPGWKSDFDRAKQMAAENPEKAEPYLVAAITKSANEKAPIAKQMEMRREYAQILYAMGNWRKGNDQIELAIALCSGGKPANTDEAMQLGKAYQDRGWNDHQRFLKNPKLPPGNQDQEAAVAVCEKCFGPDSDEAAYKLSTLGLMYADMGQQKKGDETFLKAVTIVNNSAKAKEAAWFAYDMLARAKAVEHDYKSALEAYAKATSFTTDKSNLDRIANDLTAGLQHGETNVNPQLSRVPGLFEAEKFVELDKLAKALRTSKTSLADGRWLLDCFYEQLAGNREDETQVNRNLQKAQKWLNACPKSPTARAFLADCYLASAWIARGTGWANSVSNRGWELLQQRLAKAKALLDADPSIRQECPCSNFFYSRAALGQGWNRTEYDKLVSDCHRLWPTYRRIDFAKCYFLLPRWYGSEHEWEDYAKQRADEVGGTLGDELYAQMVWKTSSFFDNVFKESPHLSWNRVKSGFRQIFRHYPNDMSARTAFIKFATDAGDPDCIQTELSELAQRPPH